MVNQRHTRSYCFMASSTAKMVDAAIRNEEPTISGPDNVEEMDALNAQFYQENKSLPLDEVLADFRTTYQQHYWT